MKYMSRIALFVFLFAASCVEALSQTAPNVPPPVVQNPSTGENLVRFFTAKTPYEFWLACLIAMVGIIIVFALIFALRRIESIKAEDVARPIIVITVIMGTLILVTVGYTNEQIAPAFGLFGTIVGYMLGRYSQSGESGSAQQPIPESTGSRSDGAAKAE